MLATKSIIEKNVSALAASDIEESMNRVKDLQSAFSRFTLCLDEYKRLCQVEEDVLYGYDSDISDKHKCSITINGVTFTPRLERDCFIDLIESLKEQARRELSLTGLTNYPVAPEVEF